MNLKICLVFNILAVVVWGWLYSLPSPATEPELETSKLLLLFILILYLVNFIFMFIKAPNYLLKLFMVLNGLLVLGVNVLIIIFVFILPGPAYFVLLVCGAPVIASVLSIQQYRSRITIKT